MSVPFRGAPARAVLLAVLSCFFLGAFSNRAVADEYQDIQTMIFEADKAFKENRPSDAFKALSQSLGWLRGFEPRAKDYIRAGYYWANLQEPDAKKALEAVDLALLKDANAAEAYFLKAYVQGKKMSYTIPNAVSAIESLKKSLLMKKGHVDPANKYWVEDATDLLFDLFFNDLVDHAPANELATRVYQELAQVEPDNFLYHHGLGVALMRRRNFEAAAASFKRGLELSPDNWQIHLDYLAAARESLGIKGAIASYLELSKIFPRELAIELGLAMLYLDNGEKDKAMPLLQRVRDGSQIDPDPKSIKAVSIRSIRIELARTYAKAGEHEEAAPLFAFALTGLTSPATKINVTIEFARALVKVGKFDQAIGQLERALEWHRNSPRLSRIQEPLDILFELGSAYWQAGKKDKSKRDEAEIYFRKYLNEVEKGAQEKMRSSKHVEVAESLGKLYVQEGAHQKAADVFRQALEIIKYAIDKENCPASRVQFELAKALHDQGDWNACIVEAKKLLGDSEHRVKVRHILARAFIENKQPVEAIEQLSALLAGDEAADDRDESSLLMGRALVATSRPAEALKYIEDVYGKRPDDEKRALEYAEVLRLLNRLDEARDLYEKILANAKPRRSARALIGLGDLEKQLAEKTSGSQRRQRLSEAVKFYEEARVLGQATDVLGKLSQTERDLTQADADLQVQNSRIRLVLYTGGLFLAALIPIGFMAYYYRQQWALHCFRQVCELERDLIQLIRQRVQSRWLGDWDNFADEPFRGRLDYKALRNRAEREHTQDILGVANFGHLVGIVDAGWYVLGFNELCATEVADPKEVIVANLSYIGSCRICLAHFGKLEEISARHIGRDQLSQGNLRAHLSKHLHRQVKTSLKIIRSRFNVTPPPERSDLPVLTAVRAGR